MIIQSGRTNTKIIAWSSLSLQPFLINYIIHHGHFILLFFCDKVSKFLQYNLGSIWVLHEPIFYGV